MDSTSAFAPQTPLSPTQMPEPEGEALTRPLSAVGADERCPSCGSLVALDQRYCLECGQRRGDPRLPFMDAVVFMNAVSHRRREASPAPPPRRRSRISPGGALVGGIGTLLLAMGVGVLIGHSGGGATAPSRSPVQVIKVPATGAATTASSASTPVGGTGTAKKATAHHGGNGGGGGGKATAAASTGSGGGAASVLHPVAKLPPPEVKVGGTCQGGAGCEGGKFTGHFFGE